MPWHRKAMKDVIGCDKPRRGAEYPLTRGFLNGETRRTTVRHTLAEFIGFGKRTQGSETSQYLQERKSNETPKVAASEMGYSPNQSVTTFWGCRTAITDSRR